MPRALPECLPKRADFLRAAAHGRKVARPGVVVQVLRTAPEAPLRLGLTASRKVGNAVHRNRARRRLRAAFRLELAARRDGATGADRAGAIGADRAGTTGADRAGTTGADRAGTTGVDIVLIARKDTGLVDFARLRADIGAILDRSFAA